jgi:hypothetical protein
MQFHYRLITPQQLGLLNALVTHLSALISDRERLISLGESLDHVRTDNGGRHGYHARLEEQVGVAADLSLRSLLFRH